MNGVAAIYSDDLARKAGWVLVHSIWEGGLLAAVFGVARIATRRGSANLRYAVACVMLVLMMALPVITVLSSRSGVQNPQRTSSLATSARETSSQTAWRNTPSEADAQASYFFRCSQLIEPALPWMAQVWLAGVALLSARWWVGTRWLRRVRRGSTAVVEAQWIFRLERLARTLGIKRRVRLLKSALVEVPMVIGYLRPVILVPIGALLNLSAQELEAILAHELAHLRRHDHVINVFQIVVETLMFYHPAVWWISRCVREEREHCCDDLVLRLCGDRKTYVRALVSLEEARGLSQLAFAATGGSLICRVRRLLGNPGNTRPPSAAECFGVTLVAVGCVLIGLGAWRYHLPEVCQARALVKLNFMSLRTGEGPNGKPEPYLPQTECVVIRSPAVLGPVLSSFDLKRSRSGGLWDLTEKVKARPVPDTTVIEIEATDSDPNEAARLANAVANSYRSYRAAQRRQSLASDLDSLEKRFAEQEGKIRKASDEVDRLRLQVDVSDPAIAPAVYYDNPPPVLLSAETLRRIEALRIETQADYVKQKTLLTRLENMGPAELPETLQAAGCADSQLANNVEMLGIVEQKLVSLRQEYGPEHPEMLKIKAQEKDLKDRILERTEGILRGLQAKLEATREGILSLSNAVLEAQRVDVQKSTRNQRYLEAVRDLQELQRFRSILEAKISLERNETGLPGEPVEILAEASPPAAVLAPDRRRAAGLFVSGCGLVLIGCLAIRLGGTSEPSVSE